MAEAQEIEEIKEILSQHGYDSVEPLGNGAYASVFLCHSKKYNDSFSIKRVAKNTINELEYNALISLNHPNIIKLYEAFEHGEYQYLVMEYCPNGNLKEKGKLDKDTFISYSKQILQALNICHSKMIAHRDIKPENIFIGKYNKVKLADFGFAQKFNSLQSSSDKCGSLMYAAPELFKSPYVNPFQTDIWSLGATFFYMITGQFPYICPTLDELKEAVIKGQIDYSLIGNDFRIRSLITKMTSFVPENRPTAESLLQLSMYNVQKSINIPKAISLYSLKNSGSNLRVVTQSPTFTSKYTSDKSTESNTSDDLDNLANSIKKIRAYKSVIRIPQVAKNRPI